MTENKRFVTDGEVILQNNEIYVVCKGSHNADVIATALNELNDENEQLKIMCGAVREELNLADRDNTILEKENEELKNRTKQYIHKINSYSCTIKQLQDKIDVKEALCKQFEDENDQLQKDIEILNESEDISIGTNLELSNQIRDLKKELSQFRNISNDYNIPYDKLTDAFEDSISENEQLKQYKRGVSDTLWSWFNKEHSTTLWRIMKELNVDGDRKNE